MRGQRLIILGVLALFILGATLAQATLRQGEAGPTYQHTEQPPAPAGAAPANPTITTQASREPLAVARAGAASPGSSTAPTAAPSATLAPTATFTPAPTPTPAPPTPTPTPVGPVKTGQGQPPVVSAAYVAIVDEESGRLLYDKGAHQHSAPASITKIATALVALEHGDPRARVKVRFDPSELVDSTLMGLQVGDEVTLEDLLYGLMLPSGNDAALAIAEYIGGSKARFVEMMNEKVRELGLKDTQFVNPHGLDQEGHYSSAYDMTMLARYGMQRYPLFARLAAARTWTVNSSRGAYDVYNLNKLLFSYRGADGVKIGYTDAAGRTIVASATRNGRRVYVALMQSNNLVADTTPLMDYAFGNYTWP